MSNLDPQNLQPEPMGALEGKGGDKTKPHLLSRDEIEAEFGISRRWLELAALSGNGPAFIKIAPRTVRYRREELERWLAEREVRSTSEYNVREKAPKGTELNAAHASGDSSADPEKCPGAIAIEKHLESLKVGGSHD